MSFSQNHMPQVTGYIAGRPHVALRIDAIDEGIVLRFGAGPDSCDVYGAREAGKGFLGIFCQKMSELGQIVRYFFAAKA
jgi:hypothetical protein